MHDVITVGSSTVDVFAKVKSELIKIRSVSHVDELIAYPVGSKILIDKLNFLTGGGGTNTAVALSRLGLKAAYLGKIGSDNNSKLILDVLRKEKVEFIGARSKGISGYSVILDSLEGDRTILAYKGVNDELEFSDVKTSRLVAKWFYFSSMVNKSFETLEKIASYAVRNKIKVAFNPSNYLAEKGHLYLKEVLVRTNLLILNKEEATLLGGNLSMDKLVEKLMSLGPERVVITDGKNGAYTMYRNAFYHVNPTPVKVKETTGAGDAFASTFLAGVIKDKPVDYCMKMALMNAESVITHEGAKEGLLNSRSLMQRIKEAKPKVDSKKINLIV